eukprot:343774-Rhodomonas_salina.5
MSNSRENSQSPQGSRRPSTTPDEDARQMERAAALQEELGRREEAAALQEALDLSLQDQPREPEQPPHTEAGVTEGTLLMGMRRLSLADQAQAGSRWNDPMRDELISGSGGPRFSDYSSRSSRRQELTP